MPTAAEFNAAAKVLEEMLPGLDKMSNSLDGILLHTGLEGDSPAQVLVVSELDAGMTELGHGKIALSKIAADLRWRAGICTQYAAAMSDYRREMERYRQSPTPSAKPLRPIKQFAWVEE